LVRRLPEAGALLGGRSKGRIPGSSTADLSAHLVELRRAEWVHWVSIACSAVVLAVEPPSVGAALVVIAVVVNTPFLLVLRFNRLRIASVIEHRTGAA